MPTETKGLYDQVINLIEKGQTRQASDLIKSHNPRQQLEIIRKLSRDLDFFPHYPFKYPFRYLYEYLYEYPLDRDSDRYPDLDLFLDLTRAFNRALARAFSPNREFEVNRAQKISSVIISVLRNLSPKGKSISSIHLIGIDTLTPASLINDVGPYLQALAEIQSVISEIKDEPFVEPKIEAITPGSALIDMSGIAEAVRIVRDTVMRWRRERAREIADLERLKIKQEIAENEIRLKEGEMRVQAQERLVETNQQKEEEELKKLRLENQERELAIEREKLKLERARFDMYLEIVDKLGEDLSLDEKLYYVMRLKNPLDTVTLHRLELADELPEPSEEE